MNKQLLSSKSNEWETPKDLFKELNDEFSFTLDPCCTHENHTCPKYYTVEDDGLSKDWQGNIVFMNPPYGRAIGQWMAKAYEESLKGTTVVCLIPSRTDTKYWHEYCMKASEIRYIRGRLRFINRTFPSWRADGDFKVSPAPFPCAIVIFKEVSNETNQG